ncbi:Thioredoxin-like fold-containing protein [Dioscorea alata]|uniref:Thioredoxin-like fold-containing protein n=1 Tax=Dioscorea alata TaxID=55571 RepID=A0ACB7VZJ3_DIOAL|nr:Thioredoxin-like fold-containing protein [Dioscorea alata]
MPRPMVLVFLLVFLIVTSQLEWKQQLAKELEASSGIFQEQLHIADKDGFFKEKIILSQEKDIKRLKELVQSFQHQLLQCRMGIKMINVSRNPLSANADEI